MDLYMSHNYSMICLSLYSHRDTRGYPSKCGAQAALIFNIYYVCSRYTPFIDVLSIQKRNMYAPNIRSYLLGHTHPQAQAPETGDPGGPPRRRALAGTGHTTLVELCDNHDGRN